MSLEEKMEKVRQCISQHNSNVGLSESDEGYVSADETIKCLKIIGGATEEQARRLKYEEILECLPSIRIGNFKTIKPIALAKEIASIFRDRNQADVEGIGVPQKEQKCMTIPEFMTIPELLQCFDPSDKTSEVARRLIDISGNRPFLAFDENGCLLIDQSKELLEEIRQGFPPRQFINTSDGNIIPVYRVGDRPTAIVDENPCFRGRALRADGTCDQTERSWQGIPIEVRQLVRVIVERNNISSLSHVHDLLDIALGQNALALLKSRYPKQVIEFVEMKKIGKLPMLRIFLSDHNKQTRTGLGKGIKVKV